VVAAKEFFAIEIPGWVKVCVPPDVSLMTPYILLEQEDWFEDEIKFVREYLQPGMRVIDIGVNYGTYFLTAAKKIGERGKIWGFEPSTQCCSFVEASIERNGFKNIELVQAGLSNRVGTAFLSLSENMELNTVADSIGEGVECESIELLSLDHCVETLGLTGIDFIKMDAEGEESNIIQGGARFFEENSPLIMFELKHGDSVNVRLIDEFRSIGYQTYRLLPGLNVLVPFKLEEQIDAFQLNLFCCDASRAAKLSQAGRLATEEGSAISIKNCSGAWKNYLMKFPYCRDLAEVLGNNLDRSGEQEFGEYYRALDLFAYAKSGKDDLSERLAAISESRAILERTMENYPSVSVALSLARVLLDLGLRQKAVNLLSQSISAIQSRDQISLPVPFLAPTEVFENIPTSDNFEAWLYSCIFTSHQIYSSYSSYFMSEADLRSIQVINQLGMVIPEIKRRRLLARIRLGLFNDVSYKKSASTLTTKKQNAQLWQKLIKRYGLS